MCVVDFARAVSTCLREAFPIGLLASCPTMFIDLGNRAQNCSAVCPCLRVSNPAFAVAANRHGECGLGREQLPPGLRVRVGLEQKF